MSGWFGVTKLEWFGGNIFQRRIANVNKQKTVIMNDAGALTHHPFQDLSGRVWI